MEEVDKIIIDSLKHLECDISDDIQSLKQFDADMVVAAISICLEAVTPGITFPKKLPPSMSSRLNIASNLAQHIKDLGFKGDMGYQTILYCNEVEVRRVLMFLIERLPRETIKTIPIEQTGYVPRIVKIIEENIKDSLRQMWIPSSLLSSGVREYDGGYLVNSQGNSCPLQTENLNIPDLKNENEDITIIIPELKHYWIHNLPDVTKQCSSRKLIPSLLFKDNEFSENSSLSGAIKKQSQNVIVDEIQSNVKISLLPEDVKNSKKVIVEENVEKSKENKIVDLLNQLEDVKSKYVTLHEVIKNNELQLSQLRIMKHEEQEVLKDTLSKVKLKTKTLAVINKEENMAKLKNIVEIASDRLVELANQWNEVQTPLLDEYRSLQNTLTTEETKLQEEQLKLSNIKETHKKLIEDLREKSILEQSLTQNEIQKDAKHDETARKAYKLLAALRDECSCILKAVNDLGLAERESRNLQEQIETEKSKDFAVKLDRVCSDLEQIQKETQLLLT
ncbi:hypothetical protein NQ314_008127 [Rhamnusium bicolor]|uniref:Coiled-coil domain-containing protein 22 homolog n=1 Tax=Rhamnusium bicolor TaxID=1586634 RepID=A0AAV8YFG6_9CUCU|nr:hypothetical protein NQ314_008127 [Rhamnusium bicolor]